MGGHALSVDQVRLPAVEYIPLADRLENEFRVFVGGRVEPIQAYRQKPDFGDLDLLVEAEALFALSEDPEDRWEAARRWALSLGATDFAQSGGGPLSFGYPLGDGTHFQVDLIAVPAAEFDTHRDYFAWNDLGNLMGRIAHKMGMKYGSQGLVYPFREGTHLVEEVLVTRSTDQALSFMGYDASRWRAGFDGLEDLFEFASSTPFFNPDIFALENLNNKNRTRNRKRKTFMTFLGWLEKGGWQGEPFEFPEDRSVWLPMATARFPEFGRRLEDCIARQGALRVQRAKFNGRLLSTWTGLEGVALGVAMAKLRRAAGSDQDLAALVSSFDGDELRDRILGLLAASDRPRLSP